jgi:TonB family protein
VGWILLGVLCTLTGAQAEQKAKDSESLRTKYNAAVQEIERLKQDLARTRRDLEALKNHQPASGDDAPASDFFLAGNAYVSLKQYPEAVAAYTRAIARAPQDALAFRNRGIAHAALGAYQQALSDLDKALELAPHDAVAYNHRGIAHYALNNAQQATRDFTRAIELNPKLAEACNNRGIVAHRLGNYPQASKDFTQAAQLGMELASQHLQVLRDDVRQAQERLQAAGLNPGPADGVMGQQTTTALRQYQSTHGLSVTGLLDEPTRHALGITPPASSSSSPNALAEATPRFVHQPKPDYPLEARQQGWEGTVTLQLELLADGKVGEVRVAKSSGHDVLDTAAREAAQTWTHTPTVQHGQAATRWAEVTLTFALDKGSKAEESR